MRRRGVIAAMVILVGALPANAQVQDPAVSVAPSGDFATTELGDPWDYAQPSDILADPNGPTLGVTGLSVQDGQAAWSGRDQHYVSPHDMTIPGALPDSRDGLANPIDADTYTHVSLRLYSSERIAGGVQWFVCNDYSEACFRFHNVTFEPGWHLYDLDLSALSAHWRDDVLGLRLAGGATTDLRLDWLRVHDGGIDVPIPGPAPRTLEAAAPGVDGGGGATALFEDVVPTGALPPGRWIVRNGDGAVTRIDVRDAPRPVVLDPDPTGGDDHAVVVRGDPWDFSQASDWVGLANVREVRLDGGVLQATNTSDQPHVELTLGQPVDTDRFHRLTVTMTYDGRFDLGFGPGGGSHGRLVFDHLGGAFRPVSSKELVTYQSRPSATWDLTTNRVGPAVEDGAAAFDAAPVTMLRWDPNEDPGPRTWRLDDVRLAADDEADGTFALRWRDDSHAGDRTVRIGVDRDRAGFDGPSVEVAGGPGEQVLTILTDGIRPGRVWPWVEIDDGTHTVRAYARGPLHVTGRIAGSDRIATGISLARTGFPQGAGVALVASARSFPDALAGASLAAAAQGPILLSEGDGLDPRVAAELRRLGAAEVLVLGGTSAIGADVVREIEAASGATVTRVAGADRHATAAAIAVEAVARWQARGVEVSGDVLLASGSTFPDALAAGQLAAASTTPILLTPPTTLAPSARQAMDQLGTRRVVAIGGPQALRDDVTRATGRPVVRVAGADRYATAVVVRDRAVTAGASSTDVVLASGANFPDALAAGPYVAARGGSLLLTAPTALPEVVAQRIEEIGPSGRLVVAGGRVAVSDVVLEQALQRVRPGSATRAADSLRSTIAPDG